MLVKIHAPSIWAIARIVNGQLPVSKRNHTVLETHAMKNKRQAIKEAVRQRLKEEGISIAELARRAGVAYDIPRDFLRREAAMPAADKIMPVLQVLGISHMIGGDESAPMSLPLLGRVPAGVPIAVDAVTLDMAKRIAVPSVRPGWYLLEVEGDSMNLVAPAGYLLAVNPRFDLSALDGRYVIANYNGASTFKRYRSSPIVRLEPRSTNTEHEIIVPQDGDELAIQGVVELVIGDMRE